MLQKTYLMNLDMTQMMVSRVIFLVFLLNKGKKLLGLPLIPYIASLYPVIL